MTREKEIIAESIKKFPHFADRRAGFIEGAKWADRTMIEKAVKWMEDLIFQEFAGAPIERLIPNELIDDFKKAMNL